ncbi:MAG: hypothetical protein ACR2F1_03480 [Nitrososphaeraceae archaeon]
MMKQIYLIITLFTILTIGIVFINSTEIIFAQEKNETSLSEIEDSSLITIPEIDESMETNNTSSQDDNNIPLIE